MTYGKKRKWIWVAVGVFLILLSGSVAAQQVPTETEAVPSEEKKTLDNEKGDPSETAEDEEIVRMLNFLEHLDMLMDTDTELIENLEVISEQ